MKNIPILDLSEPIEILIKQIYEICTEVGFFYVKNHNVKNIEKILSHVVNFFNLDEQTKLKLAVNKFNKNNSNTYRGYFPIIFKENKDIKEGYEFGMNFNTDFENNTQTKLKYYEKMIWFEDKLLDMQEDLMVYFEQVGGLGKLLMSLIGLSFFNDYNYFDEYFVNNISTLRILHYPKINISTNKISCKEHHDSGVLTILYQDEVGGLEIEYKDKWISVPWIENTFVINLGATLNKWTNNKILATNHRVINKGINRYSIPFFYEPNPHTIIPNINLTYKDFLEKSMSKFVEYN